MDDGCDKRLPNFVVSSRHEKGFLYTRHEVAGLQVKRTLFVPIENRGFVMRLELDLLDRPTDFSKMGLQKNIKKTKRKIRIHFIIDGNITSYGLAAISQSNYSKLITTENCLQIQTSAKKGVAHYYGTIGVAPKDLRPSKILMDSFDNDLELSYDIEIEVGKSDEISLVGAGSFNSSKDCIKEYRFIRDNYRQLLDDTHEHFIAVSSSTLYAESTAKQNPTIAKLIKALEKAKVSMEYLKAEYDELGAGICAGLPRFPNYWARDTGWSLRGYLSMEDYYFAYSIIENFLRYQAKKTSSIAKKVSYL